MLDRPNRLFETWLEEWRNETALRNSDLQHHFAKALDSLKKYPLPLRSGRDCIILQHFGAKLCSMLDRKLEEECKKRRLEEECKKRRSADAADDYVVVSSDEEHAIASEKVPAEEDRTTGAVQEKTVMVKQVRNSKKNASEHLVNANQIASRHVDRQIHLQPDIFDIILLVDTQETCGWV